MIRILICDDEERFLAKMRDFVESALSDRNIPAEIYAYQSMKEMDESVLSCSDIAFLDIDFANGAYTGIDMARKLREAGKDTILIFVTNFIEFAPEGYEVQAFRYLLKRDLQTALPRYLDQALAHLQASKTTFKIQRNGEVKELLLEDIFYFAVWQHDVTAYVQNKNGSEILTYTFPESLSNLEQQLEHQGFLRIHKSFLVNMRHIRKFQCREMTLDNGTVLRVGEKKYAEQKKKYLLWKGWR